MGDCVSVPMVAFQVTLLHRQEHSFLFKCPVWSEALYTPDRDQLTTTNAGLSTLTVKTALLYDGLDNDRKAGRKPFPRTQQGHQHDTLLLKRLLNCPFNVSFMGRHVDIHNHI